MDKNVGIHASVKRERAAMQYSMRFIQGHVTGYHCYVVGFARMRIYFHWPRLV
jgi:hypothetical protein